MSVKKQNLVNSATDLFNQYGYHVVGIDRIIEESKVAKMTMYRYFASKEELVSEVLKQRMEYIEASILEAVAKKHDPLERLHGVFLWHARWFKTTDFTGCMFIGALSDFREGDGDIVRIAILQKKRMRELIQSILASLVKPSDAARLAFQIVMLLDGAIVAAQSGDKRTAAAEAWEVANRLVSLSSIPQ
jgi:AcrR family transcriptional regulator